MSGQRDGLSREELQRLAHWDSPPLNAIVASIVARREAAAAAEAVERALGTIATHNGTPVTAENLVWAATHESLCRSWIFDVLMGLYVLARGREEAGR